MWLSYQQITEVQVGVPHCISLPPVLSTLALKHRCSGIRNHVLINVEIQITKEMHPCSLTYP